MKIYKRHEKSSLRVLVFLFSFFVFFGSCANLKTPVVLDSFPHQSEAVISSKPNIWVEFSKAMDKEKMEKAFSLSSPFYQTPKGKFRWEGNKKLYYDLESPLQYGGYYTLRISSSAEDSFGNKLSVDFIVNFYVGKNRISPKVLSIVPKNLNFHVEPDCNIEIEFSQPMKSKATEQAFSISPSVPGLFEWQDNFTKLVFNPLQDLKFLQTYTLKINKSATNSFGNPLLEEVISYFKIGKDFIKPQVISVTTHNGSVVSDGVDVIEKTDKFLLTFDKSMNFSSVESAFSLKESLSGSVVSGSFLWSDNSFRKVTFYPQSDLLLEKPYRISLNANAKDVIGNSLANPFDYSFFVKGPNSRLVKVKEVRLDTSKDCSCSNPSGAFVNTSGNYKFDITSENYINALSFDKEPKWFCPIEVEFSSSMDIASVPNNILLEKKVGSSASGRFGCTYQSCYNWKNSKTITLYMTGLENKYGEQVYSITIVGGSNGVKDRKGNFMERNKKIFFNPVRQ